MSGHLKSSKEPVAGIDPDILKGIYISEHRPTHDQKWAALGPADAPFVRAALARAQEIRTEEIDPGDAYLQGLADAHAVQARQQLLDSMANFNPESILEAKD